MTNPTLAQLAKIIEKRYPKSLASDWDSIGLIVGKQKNVIKKILLTVDITKDIVNEALQNGIDLIISHHPLMLEPEEVEDVRKYKENIKELMIEKNLSLYVAHTNADAAKGGVNDSLAKILNLKNVKSFGPNNIGRYGQLEKSENIEKIIQSLKRIFPSSYNAILVSGDLKKEVNAIAVCGGSGSFLLEQVRNLNVDLFISADLKHHSVLDNKELSGPALISLSHWASERIWLDDFLIQLKEDLQKANLISEVLITTRTTDPWDLNVGSN
ncbi:MAG: Nif3-like dinuclear metal center hexameric protein [Candidatus Nanopelagicales bacterium]